MILPEPGDRNEEGFAYPPDQPGSRAAHHANRWQRFRWQQDKDVAHAIVHAAEQGFSGEETHFDVIALSTHGQGVATLGDGKCDGACPEYDALASVGGAANRIEFVIVIGCNTVGIR